MDVVVPLVEDPCPDLVGLGLAHLPPAIDDVEFPAPLAFLASAMAHLLIAVDDDDRVPLRNAGRPVNEEVRGDQ